MLESTFLKEQMKKRKAAEEGESSSKRGEC